MKLFSRKMLFLIILGLIAITSYQNCAPQKTFTSNNEGIIAYEQDSTNPLSLSTQGTTNKVKDGKIPESDAGFTYIGIYQLKNRENNKCIGWSSVDSYYSTFDCSETFTEYMVYPFQDGTYALCKDGTLKYYENNLFITPIQRTVSELEVLGLVRFKRPAPRKYVRLVRELKYQLYF